MNVLCFAPVDNGGQMINLTCALNKYTDHNVRCITGKQTYLDYDTDILLAHHTPAELRELLVDTDFFIFSEALPEDVKNTMLKLGLYHRVKPNNTIIRAAGSYKTMNTRKLFDGWTLDDWMFAGPYDDWFISGRVGRMAPVDYICPIDKMPTPDLKKSPIRICCSATRKAKGVDEFVRVTNRIVKEFPDVERVLIRGQTWENSVNQKAGCHITFDQFMLKHAANSSIESMYLGHVVLSDIRSWCRVLHPDLPVINVKNEKELYDRLVHTIDDGIDPWIRRAGYEYVLAHHSPKVVAKQWEYLIDHVYNEKNKTEVYPTG